MSAVAVKIVYCGGWGYRPKAQRVIDAIRKAQPDPSKVTTEMTPTPNVSGFLEVTVDGTLVHSKKNGQGYVDTDEKMKNIVDSVNKAVAAKDKK